MFSAGFWEVCVVLLIALLVLGPKRLPQVARTLGRWLANIRNMTAGIQQQLEQEVEDVTKTEDKSGREQQKGEAEENNRIQEQKKSPTTEVT